MITHYPEQKPVWRKKHEATTDNVGNYAVLNSNNNIYLLQLGCYPVAVVILHVN